jgi:hypothetical protein
MSVTIYGIFFVLICDNFLVWCMISVVSILGIAMCAIQKVLFHLTVAKIMGNTRKCALLAVILGCELDL